MKKLWVILVAFSLFWSSPDGHAEDLDHELVKASAQVNADIETVDKIGFPYDPSVVIPEKPSTFNASDPTTPNEKCKDTLSIGYYQFLGEYPNPFLQGYGKGKLGNFSLRFILFRKLRL